MTCSTSIVQFNFPITDINLNTVEKAKFLSSKEPNQIYTSCSPNGNQLDRLVSISKGNCVQESCKSPEHQQSNVINSHLDENLNSTTTNTDSNNMSNGLSNGHDLNLDYDISGNLISQLNSSTSFPISEQSNSTVNPVSSASSSALNQSIFASSTVNNTMGLLTHDKDVLSPNLLFLKGNKIENGQKILFTHEAQWTDLKPTLIEDSIDSLPHLTFASNDVNKTTPTNNNENSTSTDHSQDKVPVTYLVKSESSQPLDASQNVVSTSITTNVNVCPDQQIVNHLPSKSDVPIESSSECNLIETKPSCSDSVTSDSASSTSRKVDLYREQKDLDNFSAELMRRVRRIQVQHNHKNVTKQLKVFITEQQKLNEIQCQRFELDFSNFFRFVSDNPRFKNFLPKEYLPTTEERSRLEHVSSTTTTPPPFLALNSSNDSRHLFNKSHSSLPYKGPCLNSLPPTNEFHQEHSSQITSATSDSAIHISRHSNLLPLNQNNVKRISNENKSKLLTTIDTLRYNLRHLESKYDSDATDSSSGGESCDEFDEIDEKSSTYSNFTTTSSHLTTSKPYVPTRNRPSWKWCHERSSIAARWSWLQANISDLETRLRQANDIFRHLRGTKGSICFGDNHKVQRQFPTLSPAHSVTGPNSTPTVTTCLPLLENKLTESRNSQLSLVSDSQTSEDVNPSTEQENGLDEEETSCMRTMPFIAMKRRKILRAEPTLAGSNKKTVKYSTMPCSCNIYPPCFPPCVICNGRYTYMPNIDTEFMSYNQRVSLLDPACHPILCTPKDVSLDLYIAQALKAEINCKQMLSRSKKKKTTPNNEGPQKTKKTVTSNSSTKSSSNKKKLDASSNSSASKKKRRLSGESSKNAKRDRLSSGCSSRADSPVPSPSPSEGSCNGVAGLAQTPAHLVAAVNRRRRSEQHMFDINNIVIPYSIAAATRVERLHYKEIITPKWRINEEFTIPPPEHVRQQLLSKNFILKEDVSENALEIRHAKCEQAERQRILSFFGANQKNQNARKDSKRVRFESKSEPGGGDQSSQDSCSSKFKSKATTTTTNECIFERKRHSSFSKSLSREDTFYEEQYEILSPYELRQFPLPDALYQSMMQAASLAEKEEEALERNRRHCTVGESMPMEDSDDGTLLNSHLSSPLNRVGGHCDEPISAHLYHDDDIACEEKDDPEWTPS